MESDSLLIKNQTNQSNNYLTLSNENSSETYLNHSGEVGNPTENTTVNTMSSHRSSYQQAITTEPTPMRSGAYLNKPTVINILLVGRSQVGKSTLIESLDNPTYSSSKTGISQTREPTYKQLKMTSEDGREYTVNIIDTPGLREIRNDPNETRTDEELLYLLKKVFRDGQIRALNMIGFVSVMGKTYQNDIDTFKSLMNFFGPRFKPISALILTHCDKVSNERIQQLTEELKANQACWDVVNYCELGVHHHGTLDVDDLETYTPDLRERMRQLTLSHLAPMRADLKRFIFAQANHSTEFRESDFRDFERRLMRPRLSAVDKCLNCICCRNKDD